MSEFLTDQEIDSMFDEEAPFYDDEPPPLTDRRPAQMQAAAPEPIPLYPLQLVQPAAAQTEPRGLLLRRYGGVPGWAWGLIGAGLLGSGYMFYRSRSLQPNGEGGSEPPAPGLGDVVPLTNTGTSDGGWRPSRSSFAIALERYYAKKGMSSHVKVWVDADDAKKSGMKFVSPLVNVQVKSGGLKADDALQKFCRREGLNAVQHEDGSIGLYPHTGKRGKAWEDYIDALRDDGQQV
jgi:hypothetical protein